MTLALSSCLRQALLPGSSTSVEGLPLRESPPLLPTEGAASMRRLLCIFGHKSRHMGYEQLWEDVSMELVSCVRCHTVIDAWAERNSAR